MRSTPDNWEPMEDSDVADWASMPLIEVSRPEDVLVHEVWTLAVEVQQLRSINNKAAEEIERLRDAGDALEFMLSFYVKHFSPVGAGHMAKEEALVALAAWQEAHCER